MQETLNFLGIIDNVIKRRQAIPKHTQSVRQKLAGKRHRFPYARAINFKEREVEYEKEYPRWLTQKEGFMQFMYKNYERKLKSIPLICQKSDRAFDEKYFVSLYLQQIPLFSKLPQPVIDIILAQITTRYFKPGEQVHSGGVPPFMGVIFVGAVGFKVDGRMVICEKNEVILRESFYGRVHEAVVCREEAIILVLETDVYRLITNRLREEMEVKERDEILDLLKSTFFNQLNLKDKRARAFFNLFELKFYFDGETIAEAGSDVTHFSLIFRGQVSEENHIYIREHNKWPLPQHKWEVRAVYNSYSKETTLKRYTFFGDEEIMTNTKFKSRYKANGWVVLFVIEAEKFLASLSNQESKRLKKFRSEHVEINFGQFEQNIRKKARSLSQQRNIIKKVISGSLAHRDNLTPRKMSMIGHFEKTMLSKTFFEGS